MIHIMKQLLTRRRELVLLLLGANIVYFCFINPRGANPAVLFGGFFVLALDIYALFRVIGKVFRLVTNRTRRSRRPVIIATCTAVVLTALQSIGQLTLKDTVALAIIGLIILFYTTYFRPAAKG